MLVKFPGGDLTGWAKVLVFAVFAILVAQFLGVDLSVMQLAMDDRIFSHKERKERMERKCR